MKRRRKDGPLTLDQLTPAAPGAGPAAWATRRPHGGAGSLLNIAAFLRHAAARLPQQAAVVAPAGGGAGVAWSQLSFEELDDASDRLAHGLVAAGLRRGDRVAVLLPASLDGAVTCIALLKAGAVPVLADATTLDPRRAFAGLELARPAGIVAPPLLLAASILARRQLSSVRLRVAAGPFLPHPLPFGAHSLRGLAMRERVPFELAATSTQDDALALFTTPASGKGRLVVHDHGTLAAQADALRTALGVRETESVATSSLPATLLAVALGMTAVTVPAARGASAKARRRHAELMAEAMRTQSVTSVFGRPATLRRVAEACLAQSRTLGTVKRVILAGEPVGPATLEHVRAALPAAAFQVVHGAVEAFPVAIISGEEILGETRTLTERGGGACLGRPVRGIDVRILEPSAMPPPEWREELAAAVGVVGEVLVRGSVVARRHRSHATRDAVEDLHASDEPWHRLGDLAWMDRQGRLWSCGRKADVVVTRFGPMHPEACEPLFEGHAAVARAIVTGVGELARQEPVLVAVLRETKPALDEAAKAKVESELIAICEKHEPTRGIKRVLFRPDLPEGRADGRPDRAAIRKWAEQRLGGARS